MTWPIEVELLTVPDCPGGQPTTQLLHDLVLELSITMRLQVTVISKQQQAEQRGFPGSPTVRIDGLDPVPSNVPPGLACRLYRTDTGLRPWPGRADLRRALAAAAGAA